jgi:chaperonin cofactor prefoldin
MEDMKEEINNDTEILKKTPIQFETSSSISQIKTLPESLDNRVEQVENRVSGKEDKIEELDQIVKDYEKNAKKR